VWNRTSHSRDDIIAELRAWPELAEAPAATSQLHLPGWPEQTVEYRQGHEIFGLHQA
jgi:hypothetical protein